jgi:hypothetical protein
MKKFPIFIGGFVAGALFLFLILYIISIKSDYSEREKLRQKLMSELLNSFDDEVQEAQIQYVEVRGKKGSVMLHTGMPKDSVQLLLGKPDEVNLRSYGSTSFEDWGYKIKNSYVSDLDIDFENGRVKSVRQH